MFRYFVPSLVVLFAGCCCHQQGTPVMYNPFDASSRIAPPATGTAVPGPTTPYYQPPPGGPPATLTQPPPAGFQGSTTSTPTPALAKTESPTNKSGTGFREVSSSNSASTDARLVSHSETIRVASEPGTSGSRTFGSPSAPRNIVTLPPAEAPKSAVRESRTNFGYRPDYTKLQGRLEYSASSSQWKLRYIPIDGKTDRFGGSVVLVDKTRMADFEDGDFVSVDGEVGRDGQDAVGYAPAYHVNGIRRL